MRLKTVKIALGLILVFLLISSPASAENNQTVVLGFGLGSFSFQEQELNDIESVIYGSEFLEWYVLDEIGIAIRNHKFYKSDSSEDDEFLLTHIHLAITWVFWGSSSDLRTAAYIGYGPGNLTYSSEEEQLDITEQVNTASGGVFLDWGGETFGVRLGVHMISGSFDYEEGSSSGTIDGSATSFDVGLRLAF